MPSPVRAPSCAVPGINHQGSPLPAHFPPQPLPQPLGAVESQHGESRKRKQSPVPAGGPPSKGLHEPAGGLTSTPGGTSLSQLGRLPSSPFICIPGVTEFVGSLWGAEAPLGCDKAWPRAAQSGTPWSSGSQASHGGRGCAEEQLWGRRRSFSPESVG